MNSHTRPSYRATCAAILAATLALGIDTDALHSLQRYCRTSWRAAGIPMQEWDDCTQETLAELLARVPQEELGHAIHEPESAERRELIRSIWRVSRRFRRASSRPLISGSEISQIAADQIEVGAEIAEREILERGLEQLPSAQSEVLRRWSQGDSIADISAELGIPASRVSDQKYKAIHKLRDLIA